jgi:anthranilate synthase component II
MILVIDNYDSFTYNLVQLVAGLGAEVLVRRNDEITTDDVADLAPAGIIVSPGPHTPREAGVSLETVRRFGRAIPILGVCLGHQAIGVAWGGRVVRARRPMHGKVSAICHGGQGAFAGLPSPVHMTRYHSLTLDPAHLPAELEAIAWTDDGDGSADIQGIRHRDLPVWGVQFHPESVASAHGRDLVANFLERTR